MCCDQAQCAATTATPREVEEAEEEEEVFDPVVRLMYLSQQSQLPQHVDPPLNHLAATTTPPPY